MLFVDMQTVDTDHHIDINYNKLPDSIRAERKREREREREGEIVLYLRDAVKDCRGAD